MTAAAVVLPPPPEPEHVALDPQHPWPGLASFTEANQEYFRGRGADAAELFGLVEKSLVTVVYGPSGLGKTSLLQAGLFPKLREANWLPVPVRFDFYDEVPLVEELFDAVRRAAGTIPERRPGETYWEFFHRKDVVFWNERHRVVRPVLVFDQFEELFTIGKERPEGRPEFFAQLTDLAAGRPSAAVIDRLASDREEAERFDPSRHRYAIVLSLREDYLAELDALRTLYPGIDAVRKRLTRMNGRNALEVVGAGKHLVDPATARAIVNFVATTDPDSTQPVDEMEVDPALLSVVCSELNKKRLAAEPPMATITRGLLDQNHASILADFYADAMAEFKDDPRVRKLVEDGLLTPNRYRASITEDQALEEFGIAPGAIGELVKHRLVRIEARGRARRIELTHDLLTSVIGESRDRRKDEEKLIAEKGRAEAERREARVRKRLRWTNIALAITGFLFVVTAIAMIVAGGMYWKWRQTQSEAARSSAQWALRAAVDSVDDDRGPEALALLAHAMRNDPGNLVPRRLAMDLLLTQLWYVTRQRWDYNEDVWVAQISRDGSKLMIGYGQSIAIRRLPDGETIATIYDPALRTAELSPDGRHLITTTTQQVVVWDTMTGRELARWDEPGDIGWFVTSPRGSYVAVVADEHVDVRAIDGTQRFRVPVPSSRWLEIRFSPDETYLAVASHAHGGDGIAVTTWDMERGEVRGPGVYKKIVPGSFAIDQSATRLATVGPNGGVMVEPLEEPSGKGRYLSGEFVSTLQFNADGSQLLGLGKGRVHVWHLSESDEALPEQRSHSFGEGLLWAAFTGDGLRVITNSPRQLRIWSLYGEPLSAPIAGVTWMYVSDDARQIALADEKSVSLLTTPGLLQVALPEGRVADWSADDTTLFLHRGETVEVLDAVSGRTRPGKSFRAEWFAVPYDGSWILSHLGASGSWTTLDMKNGRRATIPPLPDAREDENGDYFSFSGDGKRVVRAREAVDRFAAAIYEVQTGKVIRSLGEFPQAKPDDILRTIAVDYEGSRVVFLTVAGVIASWDVRKGTPPVISDGGYQSIDVNRTGEYVLASNGWHAGILGSTTLQGMTGAFPRSRNVGALAFSRDADGRYVALASRDGMVKLWQRDPQEPVGLPLRHVSEVTAIDFTPDGQRLVTSTADAIRVWDVASGVPLTRPHRSNSAQLMFGVPAHRLLIPDRSGLARVLELPDVAPLDAEGLAEVAETVAALRYDQEEGFKPIADPMKLTVPPGDTVHGKLIEMFQTTDASRRLTPFTDTTLATFMRERLAAAGENRQLAAQELAVVYPGLVPAK